jgi:hypothetical protein
VTPADEAYAAAVTTPPVPAIERMMAEDMEYPRTAMTASERANTPFEIPAERGLWNDGLITR